MSSPSEFAEAVQHLIATGLAADLGESFAAGMKAERALAELREKLAAAEAEVARMAQQVTDACEQTSSTNEAHNQLVAALEAAKTENAILHTKEAHRECGYDACEVQQLATKNAAGDLELKETIAEEERLKAENARLTKEGERLWQLVETVRRERDDSNRWHNAAQQEIARIRSSFDALAERFAQRAAKESLRAEDDTREECSRSRALARSLTWGHAAAQLRERLAPKAAPSSTTPEDNRRDS